MFLFVRQNYTLACILKYLHYLYFSVWNICEHFQRTNCWSFTLTRILILCIIPVSTKTLHFTTQTDIITWHVLSYYSYVVSHASLVTNIWGTCIYCVVVSLPPSLQSITIIICRWWFPYHWLSQEILNVKTEELFCIGYHWYRYL